MPPEPSLPRTPRPSSAAFRRRRIALGVCATVVVIGAALALAPAGRSGARTAGSTRARSTSTAAPPPAAAADPAANKHVYAAAGAGMLSPVVAGDPYRLYVPESAGTGIDVVDPLTQKVITHIHTGLDPQHVSPGYDLRTLYVTNDMANSLTPIDAATGERSGPDIPVDDPYNLYFTPDGTRAIVVAEARHRLDFYDLPGFRPRRQVDVACSGVDHLDFSADGSFLVASCEFAGRLVKVDVRSEKVVDYLVLPGSSPQDVRLDDTGTAFYVADMNLAGVHVIDAATFREIGFIHTGKDAHGIYPSRDATHFYVSNRGEGTISVIDVHSRTVTATWTIPGGGSPDMGGVSADGKVLWLSGRYSAAVYGISTDDGHLIAKIHVPHKPHGLAVWPQPGRFSLGHTGNMR